MPVPKGYKYGKRKSPAPFSEDHKRKIGEANRGKVRSAETKEKLSDARKGMRFSDEHRKNISNAMMGHRNFRK